jgi:hypothetical protein
MKRCAIVNFFNVLLFSTCLFAQNDLGRGEITTDLPNDSTLSAALPRLLTVNVSCESYPNSVTFKLYSNESDISAIWQETQVVVSHPGSYNHMILLGSTTNGVPAEVFANGGAHWLGIQCSGAAEMSRTLLTVAAYSIRSADSESLGGKPASAYALADSVNTTAITQNLNYETSRAQMVESNLALDLAAAQKSVQTESSRALGAESTLANNLSSEINNRQQAIDAEASVRQNAIAALSLLVNQLQSQVAALRATASGVNTESSSNTPASQASTQAVTVTRAKRNAR